MTAEEKTNLYRRVNEAIIEPSEPMNLVEIKAVGWNRGSHAAYINCLNPKTQNESKLSLN